MLLLEIQDAQELKPSDLVQFVIQASDGRSKEKHAVKVQRTKVNPKHCTLARTPLYPGPLRSPPNKNLLLVHTLDQATWCHAY